MKRRALIAGTAVLAAGAGCLNDDEPNDDDDAESDQSGPPFEVTTVDAPGSEAGTVSVPTDGQVQLINFIRTTCPTSRGMLSYVGEARDRLADAHDVGPDEEVLVMTVVNGSAGPQPSPSELTDFWIEQDGHWTVGIDEPGALFDHYDVTGTPTTVAVDDTGEVHWRDRGGTTAGNMVEGVERALEESDDDAGESTAGNESASASGNETEAVAAAANER
ncbi:TlpA family protein disulfide reductase [Haloterrigena alkaliphila]|uniref:Redoxin family protein n=1 Tax=Haloterrigena alkaliphila TaxID=2816475 RepID=A0A8A2VJH3_9EURY|nr:redoxin family protein [Haloterrigena alkaliphila]QSX00483.1 redoxin family protein [Haloterrigena alkaliphila]